MCVLRNKSLEFVGFLILKLDIFISNKIHMLIRFDNGNLKVKLCFFMKYIL